MREDGAIRKAGRAGFRPMSLDAVNFLTPDSLRDSSQGYSI